MSDSPVSDSERLDRISLAGRELENRERLGLSFAEKERLEKEWETLLSEAERLDLELTRADEVIETFMDSNVENPAETIRTPDEFRDYLIREIPRLRTLVESNQLTSGSRDTLAELLREMEDDLERMR